MRHSYPPTCGPQLSVDMTSYGRRHDMRNIHSSLVYTTTLGGKQLFKVSLNLIICGNAESFIKKICN